MSTGVNTRDIQFCGGAGWSGGGLVLSWEAKWKGGGALPLWNTSWHGFQAEARQDLGDSAGGAPATELEAGDG